MVQFVLDYSHVFPAHAGMSLRLAVKVVEESGFPRSRGDEPNYRR